MAAATAYRTEEERQQIFGIVVKVLTTLCDCPHHGSLRLLLFESSAGLVLPVVVSRWHILRRGGIDRAYERVLELEGFVAAQDESKEGPNNA